MLAVVFVFLVLAAQYESLTLPLAVILIVPMCLVASIVGVVLRGQDNNILTQVGLRGADRAGGEERDPDRRVRQAARGPRPQALRGGGGSGAPAAAPDPDDVVRLHLRRAALVWAVGAGAELRQTLGTAVFSGMIGVTVFGLIFTPAFYVICRWIALRLSAQRRRRATPEQPAE